MLTRRLIPSLLIRDGRLVKGVRYAGHRDAGNPKTTARAHNAQGADEILLLDIDASKEGRGPAVETFRDVAAECSIPLTVGGGIRTSDHARRCLDIGADKICLTTTAMDNPNCIDQLARLLGSQAIVVGLDICRSGADLRLYDHRTDTVIPDSDPLTWATEMVARGAGEIRLMSVDHEGARNGMDTDLANQMADHVSVPIILEGGAGSLEQTSVGLHSGVSAVALGSLLVFSDNNLVKIRRFLEADGHHMRKA